MFDPYSQSSQHTRSEAFSQPETLTTWMEMARQSQMDDPEARWEKPFTENPLSAFVAKLLASFQRQPAKPVRIHRQYLPLKHHSSMHR